MESNDDFLRLLNIVKEWMYGEDYHPFNRYLSLYQYFTNHIFKNVY